MKKNSVLLLSLLVAACATTQPLTTTAPEGIAAQLPSALPQIDGATGEAAIAAGTFSEAEAALDRSDMAYYQNTFQRALETGRIGLAADWQNPDSGNSGSTTPIRNLQLEDRACREFSQQATVQGTLYQRNGIACRKPDASWEVQP